MNYLKYLGSITTFHSKKWGLLKVESAHFTPAADGDLVVYIGNPEMSKNPLVRIHSECVFAEAFHSDFCDCADQLDLAMERLVESSEGILFYLRFDGRGAGLSAKVAATNLEMQGMDTYESRVKIGVDPEGRDFSSIGVFLKEKGFDEITLLTNNPKKISDIESAGIKVNTSPLYLENPNKNVEKLYITKSKKFDHSIPGYNDSASK